jgi:23S rRNA (pseudouridine1915-N3)-methyltransferase
VRYRVVCVGKKSRDPLLEVADGYLERLQHYVPCELERLREGTRESEGKEILKAAGTRGLLVALDERGKEPSTLELAQRLQRWGNQSVPVVTFAIGGADGLHEDVLGKAHERVALSRLTLPHRLALVVLLEQLYRAHTVLRGEPYHRP